MPAFNIDQFLESSEAFNRIATAPDAVDREDIETWLSIFDPEVHFEPQQSELHGEGYAGHAGMKQWLLDIGSAYGPCRVDLSEMRDLGDRLLALGTIHITGRGSGIEAEVPIGMVATFRDGLITHLKDYGHHSEAIAACASS